MKLTRRFKNVIKKKFPNFTAKVKEIKRPFNPFFHWLKFGPFGYNSTPTRLGIIKRRLFPNLPSRYSSIKTLKDIHKGEKIFIVATGPSLTVHDLDMLKGHLCMSVNSIE